MFQTLEDNEIIENNFVKKINVLKSVPERNKTYTTTEQKDIFKYLEKQDAVLYLFVQFISYNFLRPVEVCRLKIGDIDLIDKKIYVRAKNKPVKIKIILCINITTLIIQFFIAFIYNAMHSYFIPFNKNTFSFSVLSLEYLLPILLNFNKTQNSDIIQHNLTRILF
ncbi:hypothetical protein LPB303_15165 [Polaribacter atrinae]|uniref:Tyr recombinase domain-containing protein n=1 Tax=Polaribacter atrinae TaxID=1333662 RepID=A0A176T3A0_9FLAO|nr:hypothetical protein LPB303_15165 [Polaribacter atrinae]